MTNNFKTILVPLDGSKYSKKALQRASEIAHAFDSKLILLYVVEKSSVNLLDRQEYLKMLRKFGKKPLTMQIKHLQKKEFLQNLSLKKETLSLKLKKL